jgi:hypothetical protein
MNKCKKLQVMTQHEFLPLCDVLFNIISLASYFCDVVFDAVMVFALYQQGHLLWCVVSLVFVLFSNLLCQSMSLRWYLQNTQQRAEKECSRASLVSLHMMQCGILWRYFKLFIPVDLRYIKHEVRDLCMLRLMHAFCEAAPMLLIQLYLFWQMVSPKEFSDLNKVEIIFMLENFYQKKTVLLENV